MALLAIIANCVLAIKEWAPLFYAIIWLCGWIFYLSICVDYWLAECEIIASNVFQLFSTFTGKVRACMYLYLYSDSDTLWTAQHTLMRRHLKVSLPNGSKLW